MYDAVIVGARCAGSSTAMLLAQKGYRVLLVDRANFPSDTLSSHQIQIRGGAALKRWGLLEQVLATGSPSVHQVQFDAGYVRFQGQFPPLEGVDGIVSPRRIVLDKILVDRAVAAGVELREDLVVDGLIFENDRVTGIHGRTKAGRAGVEAGVVEKARIVIGADGKHSLVAKEARALEYHVKPALTCAYYTYWEGLDLSMGRLFVLPRSSLGIWPTHQSLSMVYTAYPIAEFQAVRSDIAGRFWKTIEAVPGLADKLRAGKQAERFYGTADLPAFYRRPYGPGWALVGDAGMTLDPITGQGIGNAFCDAERLSGALESVFSGVIPFETAMAGYEQKRNQDTLPTFEFTADLAAFKPMTSEQQILFSVLANKPAAANQFFGVLTGSFPFQDFFSPSNIFRLLGPAGMGRILVSKLGWGRRESRQFSI